MKTLTGLSEPVLNLNGEPLFDGTKVITVGSIIANSLARGSSGEPVRAMAVAIRVHNAKGSVELEDADFTLVEQAVKEDRTINNMAKAAALAALSNSQDAEKPK